MPVENASPKAFRNSMGIGMPRVLPPTTMYRSNIPVPTHPGESVPGDWGAYRDRGCPEVLEY
jgi:hypothetical protein